jgi:hypothetical protein
VSAVTDDARELRNRIELWLNRLVQRHDLAVLLLDQGVDGSLLRRRQLQLFSHSLTISAGSTPMLPLRIHHPISGKSKRAAGDESAEQEH